MAISTDDASASTEANNDGNEDAPVQPDTAVEQNTADEDAAPADDVNIEDAADKAVIDMDSDDLPDNQPTTAISVEPGNSEVHPAVKVDLKNILEALQDSLDKTQYISSKIGAVSDDTDRLIKQVNSISINCELLTAEMESITSGANRKNMLSKTFLTISSVVIALLVIFQLYMFISQLKTQRLQNAAGSSVLENITNLNTKMADYNKNITKVLEKPVQQEQAPPNPAVAANSGHETGGIKEVAPVNVTPVLEKLNKLRNGLPEKKLVRKETGDWFVYNKKIGECIADVDVIEALNQGYRKIGRSLPPNVPMPAHNALCILKPDGKGGTEVVMTKVFLP